MIENDKQVTDNGTERMDGDEVANAAAETLHGERANEEKHEQPDAIVLPGHGGTLIADDAPGEPSGRRA
jgi:hypothetical protein